MAQARNYPITLLHWSRWGAFDYAGAYGTLGYTGPKPGKKRYTKALLTRSFNAFQRIDEVVYGNGKSEPVWTNTRLDAGFIAIYGTSPNIGLGLPRYMPDSTADRMFEQVENSPGRNISTLLELLEPEEDFFDTMQAEARAALLTIDFTTDEFLDLEHWSEGVVKLEGTWYEFATLAYKAATTLEITAKLNGTTFDGESYIPPLLGATSRWLHQQNQGPFVAGKIYGSAGPFPAWMWSLNLSKVLIRSERANAVEYRLVSVGDTSEVACTVNRTFTGGIMLPPEATEPEVIRGVVAYPPYQQRYLINNVPPPSCFTPQR
jgi:hypothetical protein